MHEATLLLREAKLGPDHRDTLQSRNNLANAYVVTGRLSEAIATCTRGRSSFGGQAGGLTIPPR